MKRLRVPGRVNLIGDHTDYTGGLVFPMAIDRYTVIEYEDTEEEVRLFSENENSSIYFSLGDGYAPNIEPRWGRYVSAIASLIESPRGISGTITSSIPIGAGLSSSASLELACALAMGADDAPTKLALMAQQAEQLATGVPTGIMDQLCIAHAQADAATLIDCHSLMVSHVHMPREIEIVVQFIAHRTLEGSEYADRVSDCSAAELVIGPLYRAQQDDVKNISDEKIRRRARHVISENQRVLDFIDALDTGDYVTAGHVMSESHRSLSQDFETSNTTMDQAVATAVATDGVFGARMTGGGFGGCIVALCSPQSPLPGWRVRASNGPEWL